MNNLKQLKQELEETKNKCAEIEKKIEELESKVRWRARENEIYYYITSCGKIYAARDGYCDTENGIYELGDYFKTKEEAEKAVEKIKIYTKLKDLALRLNKGEKIDWTNHDQTKYYIYYDCKTMTLDYSNDWSYRKIGQIYCLDENFLEEAKREMGEKNLRKLFVQAGEEDEQKIL